MPTSPKRLEALKQMELLLGKPYIWGKKGPEQFDCSGAWTYAVWKAGGKDLRHCSSQMLYDSLPKTDAPMMGDAVFYGIPGRPSNRISHIMMLVGDGRIIGASGGGRQTLTPIPSAFVKYRPTVFYRPGFLGFGIAPLD